MAWPHGAPRSGVGRGGGRTVRNGDKLSIRLPRVASLGRTNPYKTSAVPRSPAPDARRQPGCQLSMFIPKLNSEQEECIKMHLHTGAISKTQTIKDCNFIVMNAIFNAQ